MATTKAIKKRISSVTNTQKIMKAMDLVAASKLQKAKARMDDVRPLFQNIGEFMDGVKSCINADDEEVAFCDVREVKSIAYIVLTSDRGLCGGYNANVSKKALSLIESNVDTEEKIITIGSKGLDYLRRRNKKIVYKYPGATEDTPFETAELIGGLVASMYTTGEIDEAYLVYTRFESILSHSPHIEKLLPIRAGSNDKIVSDGDSDTESETGSTGAALNMEYEPDIATFVSYAVPMYLNVSVFGAMMESAVCEYASRMTSMDAATRNADEIIDDLTIEYNQKRQGLITQEITEIVSGANALS